MKYSIVIPTYNNCDKYLKPCIDSIIRYTNLDDIELIISANGCTDNTKRYLDYLISVFEQQGCGHNFKYVIRPEPSGYAKAINDGVKVATCDKIVLLNNDTVLLEQRQNQWLEMLEWPFKNDKKAGISCVIKNRCDEADAFFAVFFCVMIDRKVFDTIGLLNEEYGVGFGEDIEFSLEATRAGFNICEVFEKFEKGGLYTGMFPIYHVGEGTVHDSTLVSGWDDALKANIGRITAKYGVSAIKESLRWMTEIDEEAEEHYNEVIKHNIYEINRIKMEGREVLDIGANIGTFSIFASKLGAKKVVSVEPVSGTLSTFKANIDRAGAKNITPLQNIASNVTGELVRIGLHDKTGHNSVYKETEHFEEIPTISFKDLLKMFETDDIFLKMDCEGGEYDILLNVDPKDMRRIAEITIEVHGDLHPKHKGVKLIQNRLSELGFKQVKHHEVFGWDGVDGSGNRINLRSLNITQESWVRV